ncbi:hypothetical protein ZIOFF_051563 [Zingiber officinale]|uniref:CS domain-containing protein n=1 Tax=Zingiber officinale TaxID=94328 RepID=A0A8J5FM89_ZINOF|nr:hypothetical protein ZIOFF_051563 [Zingiber officinale]
MAEKLAPEKRHSFFNGEQKVFEWDQTLDEVNMYIDLPPNVPKKLFYCKIQSGHVEVGIKGNPPYLNHDLACPVKTDSSFWTLGNTFMFSFNLDMLFCKFLFITTSTFAIGRSKLEIGLSSNSESMGSDYGLVASSTCAISCIIGFRVDSWLCLVEVGRPKEVGQPKEVGRPNEVVYCQKVAETHAVCCANPSKSPYSGLVYRNVHTVDTLFVEQGKFSHLEQQEIVSGCTLLHGGCCIGSDLRLEDLLESIHLFLGKGRCFGASTVVVLPRCLYFRVGFQFAGFGGCFRATQKIPLEVRERFHAEDLATHFIEKLVKSHKKFEYPFSLNDLLEVCSVVGALPLMGFKMIQLLPRPFGFCCLHKIEDEVMHVTLQKRDKGKTWSSPILGQGLLDPYAADLEQKRLMLQRFQEENPGFDFSQAQFSGTCPDPRSFMGGIS